MIRIRAYAHDAHDAPKFMPQKAYYAIRIYGSISVYAFIILGRKFVEKTKYTVHFVVIQKKISNSSGHYTNSSTDFR